MKRLARNSDLLLLALILGGFAYVASLRLGSVPVPQTDESYTLQVPYQMLYRDKLALPMHRYLRGNIENAWHSLTPLYFLIITGFFKVFDWGLAEGRAFNLITALLTLVMVYLINRRFFDWRAGLIPVVLLVCDNTFIERSRLLRNDYAAASLALLAFYLYEVAEERKRKRYYVASGLAAGAGVMCHTNILYMLAVIGMLMLLRDGWRVVKEKKAYLFYGSALAVMAYEAFSILIDLPNFLLQNRGDKLHFQALSLEGLWLNIDKENMRYEKWFRGGDFLPNLPRTLLHLFQVLAAAALVYLIVKCVIAVRRKSAAGEIRVHFLVATLFVVFFMAVVAGNKDLYYIAHIAPWFALCVGIMLRDALGQVARLRAARSGGAKLAYGIIVGMLMLGGLAYAREARSLYRGYIREVRNPDTASFQEINRVLRELVPEGVCPIAMKSPVMWLAFPEYDWCFASLETRMQDVDIDGKEYAVILPNALLNLRKKWDAALEGKYHLLGELSDTAYGLIRVYYTGKDEGILSLAPRRFRFFGKELGHFKEEQLSNAREVWSAGPLGQAGAVTGAETSDEAIIIEPAPPSAGRVRLVEFSTAQLKPYTIYQIELYGEDPTSKWEVVVRDNKTGVWLAQGKVSPEESNGPATTFFKTFATDSVAIGFAVFDEAETGSVRIHRMAIKEVAPLEFARRS